MSVRTVLRKQLARRAYLWLGIVAVGILLDEVVKEGYWFRLADLTHEGVFLTVLAAGAAWYLRGRWKA